MARSRACPSSSSPIGVSRIIGAWRRRGSASRRRNGSTPQAALADVGVAVLARPQGADRIVEVHAADEVEADLACELGQEVVPTGGAVERVAGGKGVAGVEADAEAMPAFGLCPDRRQVLQPASQHGSLAGGDLEQDSGRAGPELAIHGIERPGDRREPGLLPRSHVRAGMHHQRRDSERFATAELVGERRPGPREDLRIRRSEVDEIRRVRDHRSDRARRMRRAEGRRVLRQQRFALPLARALDEDLQAVASQPGATTHPFDEPPGDRDVRAEERGGTLRVAGSSRHSNPPDSPALAC